MFYHQRKTSKFEIQIELSDYCNSKCPACARFTDGRDGLVASKTVDKHNISLEDFSSWFSPEFISKNLLNLRINGQVGESTLCKDLIPIVRYLGINNPDINYMSLSSNGGTNTKKWWWRLGKEFSRMPNARVVFAVDGLEDTLQMYRVGVDFNKVMENAQAFIDAGGKAQWRMLTFKHNEHQVEDCKDLSRRMGFDWFEVRPTGGFVNDNTLKYSFKGNDYVLEPPSDQSKIMKVPETLNPSQVECVAVIGDQGEFVNRLTIDNRGVVHPCCFFSYECRRVYHKFYETGDPTPELGVGRRTNMYYNSVANLLEEQGGIKSICLYHNSLEDILETSFYKNRLEESWNKKDHNGDMSVCGFMCSKKTKDDGSNWRMGTRNIQHALI